MIYLVIFMFVVIVFLLGVITIQKQNQKRLEQTLAELEILVDDLKDGKIYP